MARRTKKRTPSRTSRRTDELLRLQHLVTGLMAEAVTLAGGAEGALRAICQTEGWDCGEFWRPDERGVTMRRLAHWASTEGETFAAASAGLQFQRGEGLIGMVWHTREPLWLADTVTDARAARRSLARETGLHGAFLCPVISGSLVAGVLAFACRRIREPEPALLQALLALASQLGLFVRRTDAEAGLRESEERFRQVVDCANEGILVYDRQLNIVVANAAAGRIIGVPLEQLIGRPGFTSLFPCVREDGSPLHPEERPTKATLRRGEPITGMVVGLKRGEGDIAWLSVNTAFLRRPGETEHYGIVSTLRDFSDRRRDELRLRQSESRFRNLTEMSSDFFWETDPQHRFADVVHGPEYSERMGGMVGHTPWELPHVNPEDTVWAELRATMEARRPIRDFEFGGALPGGTVRYFSVSGDPQIGPKGTFLGYRGVGRDVTDDAVARERIAALAYRDALTGLDNRTSLVPALEKAVERSRRRGTKLVGLFLDLDGFKEVNDAHGHDAGDRLLVEAAQRLRAVLRSADPVARLGGDEFFVVLEDLNDSAPAERVAAKLLGALQKPYDVGGADAVSVSASIGISVFPDDAGDAATLIKHADAAMYAAKEAGKNDYRFFAADPAANDLPGAAKSDRGG